MNTKVLKQINIKKIIGFLVFFFILAYLFSRTTYLFRNCGKSRLHVNAITSVDNIDVVCIGGSSTFVYWEPYLAWHEYGMTSYNLATDAARPPLMKGYADYALDVQNPDLLVIDLRSYVGNVDSVGTITENEGGIRNMTDSLPLSLNRVRAVTDVLKYYSAFTDEDVDIWSYYFDIAKYHTNYDRLGKEENWKYINNNCNSDYLGFEFYENSYHTILQEPEEYHTDERREINAITKDSLIDLLEYLKGKEVDALFVVGPVPSSKGRVEQYNTIGDIVSSYGYGFLNTNNYYEEMGIDFSKDFYNSGHVNVYGAEKYTRFVADYIKENYMISDHRADDNYLEWNGYYSLAKEKEIETKTIIDQQVIAKKEAYNLGISLSSVNDVNKWLEIARNENFTILALSKGNIPEIDFGMNISPEESGDVIRIYCGETSIYESDGCLEESYQETVGTDSKQYSINSGAGSELLVDGKQYKIEFNDSVYMLAFDNNYNQVLDAIRVYTDDSELGISLQHIDYYQ